MMSDPIADMLTRIRNAVLVSKPKVSFYFSKMKLAILKILKEEGYIVDFAILEMPSKNKEKSDFVKKELEVELKYHQGQSVIEEIKRVSKPGLRIYKSVDDLPVIMSGLGVAIISTSKGIMTDRTARSLKLGGEVICYVS